MKKNTLDNFVLYLNTVLFMIFTLLFTTQFSIHDLTLNKKLSQETQFTEFVFSPDERSESYGYFDYFQIMPRFNDVLINSDVYFQVGNPINKGLFSLNFKLEQLDVLEPGSVVISKNLAFKHSMDYGDHISVAGEVYVISDFLPNLKGFSKENREGVILLANAPSIEIGQSTFMIFNNDSTAIINNSSFVKRHEYLNLGYLTTANVFYYLIVTILLVIPFIGLFNLKRKINIFYKEGWNKFALFNHVNKNITMPTILIMIIFSSILYFVYLKKIYFLIILPSLITLIISSLFFLIVGSIVFTLIYSNRKDVTL